MGWYFAVTGAALLLAHLSREQNRLLAEKRRAPAWAGRFAPEPSPLEPVDRRWNIYDYAAVTLLVGFCASRFYVGTDYDNYYRLLERMYTGWPLSRYLESSPQEAGYTALAYLVKSITGSSFAMFWVASALTIVPTYAVIKRFTTDLRISLLFFITLGFYLTPFNLVRQGIAMGLNVWAASRLDRSRTQFLVINGVAGLFHATAWIAAAIQLLTARIRLTKTTTAVALVASVGLAAVFSQVAFLADALAALNPRYEFSLQVEEAGIGTYLVIAVRVALLAFIVWRVVEADQARWFTWSVISTGFLILGTQNVVIARLSLYFGIFLVLLLATQMRKRSQPTINAAVYVAAGIYMAMHLLSYGDLLPYQTYWTF